MTKPSASLRELGASSDEEQRRAELRLVMPEYQLDGDRRSWSTLERRFCKLTCKTSRALPFAAVSDLGARWRLAPLRAQIRRAPRDAHSALAPLKEERTLMPLLCSRVGSCDRAMLDA
jgi:hypothetical protein